MSRASSASGFVSPITAPPHKFRTDIEGLRGIAVLLVVLYHAGTPGFSGGFVGVDVFFVLSGYLITGILVREIEEKGTLDLLRFYARRARRLLPASSLVLLTTVAAGMFVYSPLEQIGLAWSAFASATYLSNVWFAYSSSDYFAASSEINPLLHTWSLSVEEQFYLVWPVLILLALRGARSRTPLIVMMITISLISLAGSLWLVETRQAWAFYGSPARAWEFGLGGLAGLLGVRMLREKPRVGWLLGWLGIGLLAVATLRFSPDTLFPGYAALVPVSGTLMLLLAGAGAPGTGVGRLLATSPLQHMGRLSYSWYLWHWPVLVLIGELVPSLSLWERLLCALAALILAAGTYALVENPIRFNRRLSLRPAVSLWFAVMLTAFGAALSVGWRYSAVRAAESAPHQWFIAAAQDRHQLGECNASWGDEEAEGCQFGAPDASPTILLFGDSHAAHWFPAFYQLAEEEGWRLVVLTKSACPAVPVVFADRRLHNPRECDRWRERAMKRILEIEPDLVVMGTAPERYDRPYGEWRDAYESTFVRLSARGISALVLWGTPVADDDLPSCLSRATMQRRNPIAACATDRSVALHPTSYLAALHASTEVDNAAVANLADEFCSDDVCEPVIDGTIVLYDDNHLTASHSERLAPVLVEHVNAVLEDAGG